MVGSFETTLLLGRKGMSSSGEAIGNLRAHLVEPYVRIRRHIVNQVKLLLIPHLPNPPRTQQAHCPMSDRFISIAN